MSWRDRPYAGGEDGQPELRIQFRRPSSAVTWLIVANVVGYLVAVVSQHATSSFDRTFGLSLDGIKSFYLWQPLSYMFVHGGVFHLLSNMLGLYIFGSEFERTFGQSRFLQLYATCGLVGGVAYLAFSAIRPGYADVPLVGASGAVYGLLIAAIIFFPHVQVILIIFPMPIRVFGLILGAILLLQLISPGGVQNPAGEVCHLAGAATGLLIFRAWGIMPRIAIGGGKGLFGGRARRAQGAWERRQRQAIDEQQEVDRILAKVHREGLQSLTRSERKTLNRATQRQRERDRELDKVHRL